MDARCYKNLDIFRYVQNEFQNAHFEDNFQHIRYMSENTHFSVSLSPVRVRSWRRSFQDTGQTSKLLRKLSTAKLHKFISKGNQSHEHVGTKQCHNSNAHKIFEAHHPIFAVGVQVHGMVSNRNCGSRGSQSVANLGQVFEQGIKPSANKRKKIKYVLLYRSFRAWCPSNRCRPRLPNQQLHKASGIAQHSPFEPAMPSRVRRPNQTTQLERS